MNILLVNEFYHPIQKGGAEVSVQLLAEEYKKQGNDVTILTSNNKNELDCINGIKIIRANLNPFGWFGHKEPQNKIQKLLWHTLDSYNILAKNKIKEILDDVKPDVIHTNNLSHFSCIIWKLAKEKKIPICHTLRDYYLLCPKRTLFNNHKHCDKQCLSCKFLSFPKKTASKYVDAVVGISNHILQKHLYNGFFPNALQKQVIFNSIGETKQLPRNKKNYNIGFLGQVSESKGIEILIKAFSACNNKKYTLLIAGKCENNYLHFLKNIDCIKNCNIKFIGKINRDIFFEQIDVLVVPSIWEEPFGRTVIEAISANIPVIAASSGGIPEILNNRKEGILFKATDIKELTQKLSDFMNNDISFDFSRKNEFLEQFNLGRIANQYTDILNKITNQQSSK